MKRFAIVLAGYLAVALMTAVCAEKVQAEQPPKAAAEGETLPKTMTLDLGNGVKMELLLIPAGEFMMGNKLPAAEAVKMFGGKEATYANEYPRHKVTISKPFYMGVYEVTQSQWETLMDAKPYVDKMVTKVGPEYPVSWAHSNEAIEYCSKLSKKIGKTVKLPTEAQWEYACRAGSDTVFCYGDDPKKIGDYGWFGGNMIDNEKAKTYARKGGLLKPNAWGLYDMHGNVWEWCSDWYSKDFYASGENVDPEYTTETKQRTARGGSWYNGEICLRSAGRNSWTGPNYRHYNYGFRVIVELDSSANGEQ